MPTELYRMVRGREKTIVDVDILVDGSIQAFRHDLGPEVLEMFGDSDYELWLKIPPSEVTKLALALLVEKYRGNSGAVTDLEAFCKEHNIRCIKDYWI